MRRAATALVLAVNVNGCGRLCGIARARARVCVQVCVKIRMRLGGFCVSFSVLFFQLTFPSLYCIRAGWHPENSILFIVLALFGIVGAITLYFGLQPPDPKYGSKAEVDNRPVLAQIQSTFALLKTKQVMWLSPLFMYTGVTQVMCEYVCVISNLSTDDFDLAHCRPYIIHYLNTRGYCIYIHYVYHLLSDTWGYCTLRVHAG